MEHFFLIEDLAIIAVFAAAATLLSTFLKQPPILGYIITGILLSPVCNLLHDSASINQIGELGVLFMMFFIGMEFNLEKLKKVFVPSFFGITFQMLSMALLGMAAAKVMHMTATEGVFLGAILAMNSTIVIVEHFTQRGQMSKEFAQISIGVLILEDLFAIFLLVGISGMAAQSSVGDSQNMAMQMVQKLSVMITFVVSVFVIGKLCAPYLLKKIAFSENAQLLVMFTFLLVLGLGQLAEIAQLSQALGAFLAGSIISGTAVSNRIENLSSPFRNLFIALFFVSIGTKIVPGSILNMWLPIVCITAALMVFRTFGTFLGILFGGASAKNSFFAAINLAQIGEFSFVIAGLGVNYNLISPDILSITMGVSFFTLIFSPIMSGKAENLYSGFSRLVPGKAALLFDLYHRMLKTISQSAAKSEYIKACITPFLQIGIYTVLFNAIIIVSVVILNYLYDRKIVQGYWGIGLWAALAILTFPLIIGVLKNIDTISKIIFKIAFENSHIKPATAEKMRSILRIVFQGMVAILFVVLYMAIIAYYLDKKAAAMYVVFAAIGVGIFWRKFSTINTSIKSRFLTVLTRHLKNADEARKEEMVQKLKSEYSWGGQLREITIGDLSFAAGKSVKELGIRSSTQAEIVAIKRGRFVIYDILPTMGIYPDDVVVLNGEPLSLDAAEKILLTPNDDLDNLYAEEKLNSYSQKLLVPADSPLVGKTLAQSDISRLYMVKITSIKRNSGQYAKPAADCKIEALDTVLCVGNANNLESFSKKFGLTKAD